MIRYANILGGSDTDTPAAVAVDQAGHLYVTGRTKSADFPGAKRLSASHDAFNGDIFVAKLDPSGATLIYSAIVGGGQPVAIVVDPAGSAYIAGVDPADDFPTTRGVISTTGRCFLSKLDAQGSALAWSTRLPCSATVEMHQGGLAIDTTGNAYLTAYSVISTTPGAFKTTGFGPFAMKVNAQGSALLYATYLPGDADYASAHPRAIAVDVAGNAYITGSANAHGFPVTVTTLPSEHWVPGFLTTDDVFVLKLSPDGSNLLFSVLFGGYGDDVGLVIAPQADGSIYVAGSAGTSTGFGPLSPFPTTTGALETTPGFSRAFLAKLTPAGDALVFSTFLPQSQEADCINVNDAGIDVLAFDRVPGAFPDLDVNRLLRVSSDGTSLLNSALVSNMTLPFCGQGGGVFGLAGPGSYTPQLTVSPNLSPIGPVRNTGVWFSGIAADVPGSQRLEVDAAELILRAWPQPSGSLKNVTRTIHAQTGSQAVPLGVFGNDYVSVKPSQFVTPAEISVAAPPGEYTDRLTLFAPGVQDGLVIVPVTMALSSVNLAAQPLDSGTVRLSATGPNSPPASVTLLISSSVAADAFGTMLPVRTNFTIAGLAGPLPAWLSIDPMSGVSPTHIRLTANPKGLVAGTTYYGTVQLLGPGGPRGFPFGAPGLSIPVQFTVGSVTPPPSLTTTPFAISFRLSNKHPTDSARIHLASTGTPISFAFDATPAWLSVKPASGMTPADVTVTVSPSPLSTGELFQWVQVRQGQDRTAVVLFSVTVDTVLPDYVGFLSLESMSYLWSQGSGPHFAPGGLFYIQLDRLLTAPAHPIAANPRALVSSLAGYTFKLNGLPVPLRSYSNYTFVGEVPAELGTGTFTLDAFDTSGRRIASTQMTVDAIAPNYVDFTPNGARARKADGSVIDATNPARPGEAIRVSLTGQGAVKPPIADGSAASSGIPSAPLSLVAATIGGEAADLVSASMSISEAGVLDIWLETPNLSDGDYSVEISVGDVDAGRLPIKVMSSK